jgi:hypothetical protein
LHYRPLQPPTEALIARNGELGTMMRVMSTLSTLPFAGFAADSRYQADIFPE